MSILDRVAPRRAAVLGHPIAHSLSPVLHTAAYRALGLGGWSYTALDVIPETLHTVIDGLDEAWAGLSLTMPLKHAVIPMLDELDPVASATGAVNTVVVGYQPGVAEDAAPGAAPAGRTLSGYNTDVHGLIAALREGSVIGGRGLAETGVAARVTHTLHDASTAGNAVVLGAGATAASALAALAELGVTSPHVFVRSLDRTQGLRLVADRLGVHPHYAVYDTAAVVDALATASVVISTMPKHAADPVAAELAQRPTPAPGRIAGVLLDIVYDPLRTALAEAWAQSGGTVVGGERMLLHQAARQVELMTGRDAPLGAMDDALRCLLANRTVAD